MESGGTYPGCASQQEWHGDPPEACGDFEVWRDGKQTWVSWHELTVEDIMVAEGIDREMAAKKFQAWRSGLPVVPRVRQRLSV